MPYLMLTPKMRLLNQEVRNVFYIGGEDAVVAYAQQFVDYISGSYDNRLALVLSDEFSFYACDVRDMTSPSIPAVEYIPTGGAWSGDQTADLLPTQIAALVTFKAQAAPPNRTRKYLAGFYDGACDGGFWTSTLQGYLTSWAADLLGMGSALSRAVSLIAPGWDLDHTYIVGGNILSTAQVSPVPATQRRRRIGVGI